MELLIGYLITFLLEMGVGGGSDEQEYLRNVGGSYQAYTLVRWGEHIFF